MARTAGVPEVIRTLLGYGHQATHPLQLTVAVHHPVRATSISSHDDDGDQRLQWLGNGRVRPWWRLWQATSRRRTDVVIATDLRSFAAAMIVWCLRCRHPRRVIYWIHSIELILDTRFKRAAYRVLALCSPILFVSTAVCRAHAYPGHRGRTAILHNGVVDHGVRRYGPIPRTETIRVQYTAAFVGWKNHRTLIEATAVLASRGYQLEVRLIGDGPMMVECRRLAEQLGFADRVEFTGIRLDARSLLASCDVYVHPSLGEAFGLAVVEAMIAGVPVVASDSGSFPEFIVDGWNGFLVDCSDPIRLADGLERVLTLLRSGGDPQIVERARETALVEFEPRRFVDEFSKFVTYDCRP